MPCPACHPLLRHLPFGLLYSCDYCVASYSEDPSPGDFDLVNFTVSHDLKTLIPMIHQAQASTVLPFRLFASPWSPPAWMKRNGRMDNSDVPLGLKAGAKYMETWALYFSKFVSGACMRVHARASIHVCVPTCVPVRVPGVTCPALGGYTWYDGL